LRASWPAFVLFASTAVAHEESSVVPSPASTPSDVPALAEPDVSAPDAALDPPFARWIAPPPGDPSPESLDKDGYYRNLYRRFSLSGGIAAYAKFDTNIQVNGRTAVGANLDMEDFLGLTNSSTVGRLDARYAFNRRHWVEASYYDIDRDGERSIPNDIQVGDVVIPAGETETNFDTQIFKLAYRYNFVTDPRTVIGASIGVHWMRIDLGVRSPNFDVEEEFKVDAPLPLLGLHGAYALDEKWKLSAAAELLQFDLDQYRGLVTDVRLTIDHDTFENFGWGIGFNSFKVDGTFKDGDKTTNLQYGYQGLMIYLRLLF
jgi:hypothetical protein